MIKRILISIALICLMFFAGCNKQLTPTAALLTGSNVEFEESSVQYVGRMGLQADKLDFGFMSTWLDTLEKNRPTYGVYIYQSLIKDPNIPLVGDLYLGAQVTCDLNDSGGMYGPFIGFSNNIGGIEMNTEFQYCHYNDVWAALQGNHVDKWKIAVGPKFYFPIN